MRALPQLYHDWTVTFAAAAIAAGILMKSEQSEAADPRPVWKPGDKILFRGDSITDADRESESAPDGGLGHGYVYLAAARLSTDHPERRLAFGNRGISGNTVHGLSGRWEEDTIALRPDVLSILIGVNDTAADIAFDDFEAVYQSLLEQTKAALPNVRLVLCEPFALLPREANGALHRWETNVRHRARVVEKLAEEYGARFVYFQRVFDDAIKRAPAEYWLPDGVHPAPSGHQLMADEWIRAVSAG